ncbi:MAG: hypothetical protein SVK54_07570 [candidate division WOR-3 bacterium]|nr:hypothetical protein [candidate division WOR-3 bacterium]
MFRRCITVILIVSTVMLSADVYSIGNPKIEKKSHKKDLISQYIEKKGLNNPFGSLIVGIGQIGVISFFSTFMWYGAALLILFLAVMSPNAGPFDSGPFLIGALITESIISLVSFIPVYGSIKNYNNTLSGTYITGCFLGFTGSVFLMIKAFDSIDFD